MKRRRNPRFHPPTDYGNSQVGRDVTLKTRNPGDSTFGTPATCSSQRPILTEYR